MKLRTRMGLAWNVLRGKRSATWKATDMGRMLGHWLARLRSADEEIKGDAPKIRARARELARNEGYAKQYLRLLTVNVIGPHGIKMQARVKTPAGDRDKAANDAIEAAWKDWTGRPVTADGRQNLRQLQVIALRALARDGEIFIRQLPGFPGNAHGLALQMIDADLLDENYNLEAGQGRNEIRMGVEIDPLGRPLAYWFSTSRTGFGVSSERIRVPAGEVIHLFDPDRPNQTRGVSWLHASMVPTHWLGLYEENELTASAAAAAKMGFFVNIDGTAATPEDEAPEEMEANPGTAEKLPPGWQFQSWDPQHPVASFLSFVKSLLRKIASGLGISYNSLASDLEGVNYSSMRSGLLIERDYWKTVQTDWVDSFLQPVYEAWMGMALLTGALVLPSLDARLYARAVTWKPRGWQWVDPQKDIAAAQNAIKLGISSRTKECAELGVDFEEVLQDLKMEAELAAEAGVDVSGDSRPVTQTADTPSGNGSSNGSGSSNGRDLLPAGRF